MDEYVWGTTAGKSPVNVLQELCIKYNVVPTYDLVSSKGPSHMPTFCYQVTAGNITAIGRGTNKEAAKHDAAQKAVEMIIDGTPIVGGGSPSSPSSDNDVGIAARPVIPLQAADSLVMASPMSATLPVLDDDFGVNSVGELQEYAQKHSLTLPQYEFPSETGPPHARTFVCAVTFDGKREKGYGKTKKDAKQQAAGRMVQLLNGSVQGGTGSVAHSLRPVGDEQEQRRKLKRRRCTSDVDEDDDEDSCHYESIKRKCVRPLTPDGSQATSEFFESLRNNPGTCLLGLQEQSVLSSPKVNYIQKLEEISKEKKFAVVYVHIEEPNKSDKRQCLLQLSTQPVAICFGTGETREEAEQEAAYNSLQYLKIMTSKN